MRAVNALPAVRPALWNALRNAPARLCFSSINTGPERTAATWQTRCTFIVQRISRAFIKFRSVFHRSRPRFREWQSLMQPSIFNLRVPLPGNDVFLMNTLTDAQLVVSPDV